MRKKSFTLMAGEYMSLAFLLPASTFVGYAIGWLLDRWLGTSFLQIVFLLVGIAAGLVELVRHVRKDMDNHDNGNQQ